MQDKRFSELKVGEEFVYKNTIYKKDGDRVANIANTTITINPCTIVGRPDEDFEDVKTMTTFGELREDETFYLQDDEYGHDPHTKVNEELASSTEFHIFESDTPVMRIDYVFTENEDCEQPAEREVMAE